MKDLEKKNVQLKSLAAEPALDKAILKEAARGRWSGIHQDYRVFFRTNLVRMGSLCGIRLKRPSEW